MIGRWLGLELRAFGECRVGMPLTAVGCWEMFRRYNWWVFDGVVARVVQYWLHVTVAVVQFGAILDLMSGMLCW